MGTTAKRNKYSWRQAALLRQGLVMGMVLGGAGVNVSC